MKRVWGNLWKPSVRRSNSIRIIYIFFFWKFHLFYKKYLLKISMIFFFHDYQLKIILFVRLNEHREIYN